MNWSVQWPANCFYVRFHLHHRCHRRRRRHLYLIRSSTPSVAGGWCWPSTMVSMWTWSCRCPSTVPNVDAVSSWSIFGRRHVAHWHNPANNNWIYFGANLSKMHPFSPKTPRLKRLPNKQNAINSAVLRLFYLKNGFPLFLIKFLVKTTWIIK